MRIGELARATGVNVETVRFYERKKLIEQPPRPAGGGYRSYGEEAARRIRFIRRAQSLGFSLKEIAELLSLQANPDSDCSTVRARAERQRALVDQKIKHLAALRETLDRLIEACPGTGAIDRCSILETLENGDARSKRGEAPARETSRSKR